MLDSTLPIPTLDLETIDVDELLERAWDELVAARREPPCRVSWETGYRMGLLGVLLPLAERLGIG